MTEKMSAKIMRRV